MNQVCSSESLEPYLVLMIWLWQMYKFSLQLTMHGSGPDLILVHSDILEVMLCCLLPLHQTDHWKYDTSVKYIKYECKMCANMHWNSHTHTHTCLISTFMLINYAYTSDILFGSYMKFPVNPSLDTWWNCKTSTCNKTQIHLNLKFVLCQVF